jgi:signal transduction histidine kinase/ligand-binding sensor domain-containing protein/DNA-binding NarL/FixJ family response regulator
VLRRVAVAAIVNLSMSVAVASTTARPIRFEHLTNTEGLSQSTVMAVLQDSQGFMWFATESGVNRFDGYQIARYLRDQDDPERLASDFVWALDEDSDGGVWLATIGGGLARWDRSTDRFERFRNDPANPDTIASDAIRTMLIDSRGRVWAGTQAHGVSVLDRKSRKTERLSAALGAHLPSDAVFALAEDAHHRVWIGTERGIAVVDVDKAPLVARAVLLPGETPQPRVRSLTIDKDGIVWIGTIDRGLLRYDSKEHMVRAFAHRPESSESLSDNHVRAVLEDDEGRLWVATAGGLNLLDRANGGFTRYQHDAADATSLRDSYVMSLYQDRSGVMWVGTRAGGVSRWNPRSWRLGHWRPDELRDIAVTSFADDGHGKAWIGTAGRGLVEIDIERGSAARVYETSDARGPALPDNRIMSLLRDSSGRLWVGTMDAGLTVIDSDGRRKTHRHAPDRAGSLPADGIMSLYEDRRGGLWVGTYGGGLAKYDELSDRFERYVHDPSVANSLSDSRISAIVEDGHGMMWVGTAGGGLDLLNPRTREVHSFRSVEKDSRSISDNTIYALHADAEGEIWIGTAGGGLVQVTGSSLQPESIEFTAYDSSDGLPSNVVYGIQADSTGALWLSTNFGLTRFDVARNRIDVSHVNQGLQGEEFNFGAHHRSTNGLLFFGGNNGFNVFDPARLPQPNVAPAVVLTAFEKMNRPAKLDATYWQLGSVALAHDDNVVTFEFAALDYVDPARNRYHYMLEGFDADWVDAGSVRRVSYTNLDAGTYTFRARAASADGVWTTEDLRIGVSVEPAPWASPWAKAAYAALGLLLVVLVAAGQQRRMRRAAIYQRQLETTVAERTAEIQARNAELQVLARAKSDFVARMSHELRTPMNGVLGMSELLLRGSVDPAQRRCAEAVQRAAESLVGIVDDILDLSKAEAGKMTLDLTDADLIALVESTADTFGGRAIDKKLELIVDVPPEESLRVKVDALRLRQTLTNLLSNAIKFTDRGHIMVTLALEAGQDNHVGAKFSVRDTGIGIRPESIDGIFEPFCQEDASTARRFGGTGLGLSIAKELVELMGGRLSVQSTVGAGTEFSFRLLLARVDEPATSEAKPRPLQGARWLVVSDCLPLSGVLQRHLSCWGAEVASCGRDAVESRLAHVDGLIIDEADPALLLSYAQRLSESRPVPGRGTIVHLASFKDHTSAASQTGLARLPVVELVKPARARELLEAVCTRSEGSERAPALEGTGRYPVLPRFEGRVLVAEDHDINAVVASGMLESMGLTVVRAQDGIEAVESARHAHFDLILMDCQMPRLDGFEATRRIRQSAARTPIIALTADATAQARESCFGAGMSGVITKPISVIVLARELERHLPRSTGPRVEDTPAVRLDRSTLDDLRALSPNPDAVTRVIDLYVRGSAELLADIERHASAGEFAELEKAAHAWKSYNGNIGARDLERLCRELETAATRSDEATATRLAAEARQRHREILGLLADEAQRLAS